MGILVPLQPPSSLPSTHQQPAETIQSLLKLLTPTANTTNNPSSTSSPIPTPLLNLSNSSHNTALHWAALNGHLDAVKILVAAGADMQLVNRAGRDARGEAEMGGKMEVVEWLGARCEGRGEKEEEDEDGGVEDGVQVGEGDGGVEGMEEKGKEGG